MTTTLDYPRDFPLLLIEVQELALNLLDRIRILRERFGPDRESRRWAQDEQFARPFIDGFAVRVAEFKIRIQEYLLDFREMGDFEFSGTCEVSACEMLAEIANKMERVMFDHPSAEKYGALIRRPDGTVRVPEHMLFAALRSHVGGLAAVNTIEWDRFKARVKREVAAVAARLQRNAAQGNSSASEQLSVEYLKALEEFAKSRDQFAQTLREAGTPAEDVMDSGWRHSPFGTVPAWPEKFRDDINFPVYEATKTAFERASAKWVNVFPMLTLDLRQWEKDCDERIYRDFGIGPTPNASNSQRFVGRPNARDTLSKQELVANLSVVFEIIESQHKEWYDRLGLIPKSIPDLWEGAPPEYDVLELKDLVLWLSTELDRFRVVGASHPVLADVARVMGQRAIANCQRMIDGRIANFSSQKFTDTDTLESIESAIVACLAFIREANAKEEFKKSRIQEENDPNPPKELGEPDGPRPGNQFYYQGKAFELQPIPWRLVDFLWNSPAKSAQEEDVISAVWGDDSDNNDSAIRSAMTRANNKFLEHNVPFFVSRKSGYLTLKLGGS